MKEQEVRSMIDDCMENKSKLTQLEVAFIGGITLRLNNGCGLTKWHEDHLMAAWKILGKNELDI